MYWIIVFTLDKHGILRKYNISAYFGLLLVIRTMRGQKFLDKLATPKGFWRIFANLGVPLMLISMVSMFLIFIYLVYLIIVYSPSNLSQESLGETIRMSLFIPGINPFLPFVWGWIALIVTLIVHEFAHAILCKVEGIRVKSMGILYAIIPLGGFAEPDEEQLFGVEKTNKKVATRKEKIRILTAGVMANFVVAFIALALFFGPVLSAIAPVGEVMVMKVTENSPAEHSGIKENMVITQINETQIKNANDFLIALSKVKPGSNITVHAADEGKKMKKVFEVQTIKDESDINGVRVKEVVEGSPAEKVGFKKGMIITAMDDTKINDLGDFINFMNTTHADDDIKVRVLTNDSINATSVIFNVKLAKHPLENKGFLGVSYDIENIANRLTGIEIGVFPATQQINTLKNIPSMLSGLEGWFHIFMLAIEFRGFSGILLPFYEPTGWATSLGIGIFWIANSLLWIGWVNFYVGLFNCLPGFYLPSIKIRFDGGHFFKDIVNSLLEKFMSNKEKTEKISDTIVNASAFLILFSLIFMIVGPYILY
ncbi:MAG TPA: PDZ domain-containing protein [Methanosarcinales archaeon]|nr:PDZ domain-containing protein [Methanosarcinales archaeon]